ncbi:MAG TPA: mandelate racemase/muconate lactonizing enzyme family protein [Ruminococcaceae bacterium]|nr:mandelate racemase/muconate lactonizing enzyme family protein [Oscillospiraceae bacterium]
MKILKIETYILRVPLGNERFYSSQCAFPERNSMLVHIETDEGIDGWGEGGQYGPPEPVASCINDVLAKQLIGRDPLQPMVLWDEMYASTRDFGQKGTYIEAISAIDIALWDIMGKALGKPIYTLLGGAHRKSVPAYATGCYYRGEDPFDYRSNLHRLGEEAKGYVDAGFRMLKIKVGLLPIEQDLERAAAIRQAVGNDVKLFVDCNHSYNAFNAVKMISGLEKLGVVFVEEPVIPEDLEGYKYVRSKVNMAIACGECEYTRYGFKNLITAGCIDIAQPDICVCGGLSEWMKIMALAQAFGVWTIPHVWGSGIALAAALHAIATIPEFPHTANRVVTQNEPMVEYDRNPNPLRDLLLKEKFELVNGCVVVPAGPGLGVEIDRKILEKYSVRK